MLEFYVFYLVKNWATNLLQHKLPLIDKVPGKTALLNMSYDWKNIVLIKQSNYLRDPAMQVLIKKEVIMIVMLRREVFKRALIAPGVHLWFWFANPQVILSLLHWMRRVNDSSIRILYLGSKLS